MRKLEINYDLIDKIYESNGQHKIKRTIKRYKMNDLLTIGMITSDVCRMVSGKMTPVDTALDASSWILAYIAAVFGTDYLYNLIRESRRGTTREEEADEELRLLASQLNDLNINVSLSELKEALVYHKGYRLRKDGKVGVIRERYIEVPAHITGANNEEQLVSIKEEHTMGTRSYVLTLDTPKKEMVYKPAYNM